MSKPSDLELKIALKKAASMKEQDEDSDYLAKCLLNHHYRLSYLEAVLKAADLFMNHGMGDRERTELLRNIEKAKQAEYRTANEEREDFGLE